MVFNATFNNISVMSWLLVLLVEETGVPGENHRPVASHSQTLSQNVVHLTAPWSRFELTTSVVIGTDCIGSCKSNYHTITAMTAPSLKHFWNNTSTRIDMSLHSDTLSWFRAIQPLILFINPASLVKKQKYKLDNLWFDLTWTRTHNLQDSRWTCYPLHHLTWPGLEPTIYKTSTQHVHQYTYVTPLRHNTSTHVTPLWHIILILSQPIFDLSP